MWSRVLGLSNEKQEESSSGSKRRKDEQPSQRRRTESTVSSNPTRKVSRSNDTERGFNPISTSNSTTSRSPYPGAASASVASSYATATSNNVEAPIQPPDVVRNSSLADQMPKSKSGQEEDDPAEDRERKAGRRGGRLASQDRKNDKQERPQSRNREEKRRDRKERREKRIEREEDKDRGLERSETIQQGASRAGEQPLSNVNFNSQVGGSGFTQFPGQYDGAIPGPISGPPQRPPISDHVPDQFPGQFPTGAAAPYRPPLAVSQGGPGLAADYYGDSGESVAHQPGVRPQAPSLIIGAQPHLMAASPIEAPPVEPSATGGVGAAASFFSGATFQSPSSTPVSGQQLGRPAGESQQSSGPAANFSVPATLAGSAAIGYVASTHAEGSYSQRLPNHVADPNLPPTVTGMPPSNYRPPENYPPSQIPSVNSVHAASAPIIPTIGSAAIGAAAGYMMGSHTSQPQQSSLPPRTEPLSSYVTHIAQRPPPRFEAHQESLPGNVRPSQAGKPSSPSSNIPLYAAGAIGVAGLAAAAYHHEHQGTPQASYGGETHSSTTMVHRHEHQHHGPLSKFVDFFRDPEGVARFEEYTEYIGVCRYCFEPGSTPLDAPRKHYYRKRRSNERLGANMRVDKESRYGSSDGESRRKNNSSWLAAGLEGYGLAKVGKTLFGSDRRNDDSPSASSGRPDYSTGSKVGRRYNISPDRNSSTSYGVIRRESTDIRSSKRSRSRSKDRNTGLDAATIGAVGAAIELASTSKSKQANRYSQTSSPPRVIKESNASKEPSTFLGGFFEAPPESRRSSQKKKKESKGFFNFANSSSSSTDVVLVTGSDRSRKKKHPKSKIKDHNDANAALLGLGAAAAALTAAESRRGDKGKRKVDVGAVREVKNKESRRHDRSKDRRKHTPAALEEGLWESAPEDDGHESVDSTLAYGFTRRRSQDSLRSNSSGTNKWGWRWGSKSKKRRSSFEAEVHHPTVSGMAADLVGAAAGTALLSEEAHRITATESPGDHQPLQYVHPIATSDPSHYDAARHESTFYNQPLSISRPAAIPLQQPQPVVPVSSAIYNSQTSYDYGHNTYTGPIVSSQQPRTSYQDPRYRAESAYGYVMQEASPGSRSTNAYQVLPESRELKQDRRPHRRDTAPGPEISSIEPRAQKWASSRDDVKSMRFDDIYENEDRNRGHRHRSRRESDPLTYEKEHQGIEADGEGEELRRKSNRSSAVTTEQKLRREVEIDGELERFRREEARTSEENQSPWTAPVLAGIAGAVVGATALRDSAATNRRQDQQKEAGRSKDDVTADNIDAVKSGPNSTTGVSEKDRSDDRRAAITKQAAALVKRTPSPAHQDYADFFAPADLLSNSKNKVPIDDSNGGNDITSYSVPEVREIGPPDHGDPSAYTFRGVGVEDVFDPNFMRLPWQVPRLNLIKPTPPASVAGSVRGDASPIMRPEDTHPEDAHSTVDKEIVGNPTRVNVTFGETETREYEVITPIDQHDEFFRSTDEHHGNQDGNIESQPLTNPTAKDKESPIEEITRDPMPGGFVDDIDFAATLAAGVQASGFDPAIVIDDPIYRRRDSPPGSEVTGVYRRAFMEALHDPTLDSPGTEGAPPESGYIDGELPQAPVDEGTQNVTKNINEKNRVKEGVKEEERERYNADNFQTLADNLIPLSIKSRKFTNRNGFAELHEPEIIEAVPRREFDDMMRATTDQSSDSAGIKTNSTIKDDQFYDASESQREMNRDPNSVVVLEVATHIPLPTDVKEPFLAAEHVHSSNYEGSEDQDDADVDPTNITSSIAATVPFIDDYGKSKKSRKKSKSKSPASERQLQDGGANGNSIGSEKREGRQDNQTTYVANGVSGRATQEPPAKDNKQVGDNDITSQELDADNRDNRISRSMNIDQPLSFLGMRREETEPPDKTGLPDPGGQLSMEVDEKAFRELINSKIMEEIGESLPPLPPSRPTTPTAVGSYTDLPPLPRSRPASPAATPRGKRRLSALHLTDPSHPVASPSPTAVPLIFRRFPSSSGVSRSSPSTPGMSPHGSTTFSPRPRHSRPLSTELRSSEFRPLWLVDMHDPSRRDSDRAPEEVYPLPPSVPTSHSTSRASSVHSAEEESHTEVFDQEETHHKALPTQLSDIITRPIDSTHDFLDSQQPTPTKETFRAGADIERTFSAPTIHFLDDQRTQESNVISKLPRYDWENIEELPSLPHSRGTSPSNDEDLQKSPSVGDGLIAGATVTAAAAAVTALELSPHHHLDSQDVEASREIKGDLNADGRHLENAPFSQTAQEGNSSPVSVHASIPAEIKSHAKDSSTDESTAFEELANVNPITAHGDDRGPISHESLTDTHEPLEPSSFELPESVSSEKGLKDTESQSPNIENEMSAESKEFSEDRNTIEATIDYWSSPSSSRNSKKDKTSKNKVRGVEISESKDVPEELSVLKDLAIPAEDNLIASSKKGKKNKRGKNKNPTREVFDTPYVTRYFPDQTPLTSDGVGSFDTEKQVVSQEAFTPSLDDDWTASVPIEKAETDKEVKRGSRSLGTSETFDMPGGFLDEPAEARDTAAIIDDHETSRTAEEVYSRPVEHERTTSAPSKKSKKDKKRKPKNREDVMPEVMQVSEEFPEEKETQVLEEERSEPTASSSSPSAEGFLGTLATAVTAVAGLVVAQGETHIPEQGSGMDDWQDSSRKMKKGKKQQMDIKGPANENVPTPEEMKSPVVEDAFSNTRKVEATAPQADVNDSSTKKSKRSKKSKKAQELPEFEPTGNDQIEEQSAQTETSVPGGYFESADSLGQSNVDTSQKATEEPPTEKALFTDDIPPEEIALPSDNDIELLPFEEPIETFSHVDTYATYQQREKSPVPSRTKDREISPEQVPLPLDDDNDLRSSEVSTEDSRQGEVSKMDDREQEFSITEEPDIEGFALENAALPLDHDASLVSSWAVDEMSRHAEVNDLQVIPRRSSDTEGRISELVPEQVPLPQDDDLDLLPFVSDKSKTEIQAVPESNLQGSPAFDYSEIDKVEHHPQLLRVLKELTVPAMSPEGIALPQSDDLELLPPLPATPELEAQAVPEDISEYRVAEHQASKLPTDLPMDNRSELAEGKDAQTQPLGPTTERDTPINLAEDSSSLSERYIALDSAPEVGESINNNQFKVPQEDDNDFAYPLVKKGKKGKKGRRSEPVTYFVDSLPVEENVLQTPANNSKSITTFANVPESSNINPGKETQESHDNSEDVAFSITKKGKKSKKLRKAEPVMALVESLPEEPESTEELARALDNEYATAPDSVPETSGTVKHISLQEFSNADRDDAVPGKKGKKGKKNRKSVPTTSLVESFPEGLDTTQELDEALDRESVTLPYSTPQEPAEVDVDKVLIDEQAPTRKKAKKGKKEKFSYQDFDSGFTGEPRAEDAAEIQDFEHAQPGTEVVARNMPFELGTRGDGEVESRSQDPEAKSIADVEDSNDNKNTFASILATTTTGEEGRSILANLNEAHVTESEMRFDRFNDNGTVRNASANVTEDVLASPPSDYPCAQEPIQPNPAIVTTTGPSNVTNFPLISEDLLQEEASKIMLPNEEGSELADNELATIESATDKNQNPLLVDASPVNIPADAPHGIREQENAVSIESLDFARNAHPVSGMGLLAVASNVALPASDDIDLEEQDTTHNEQVTPLELQPIEDTTDGTSHRHNGQLLPLEEILRVPLPEDSQDDFVDMPQQGHEPLSLFQMAEANLPNLDINERQDHQMRSAVVSEGEPWWANPTFEQLPNDPHEQQQEPRVDRVSEEVVQAPLSAGIQRDYQEMQEHERNAQSVSGTVRTDDMMPDKDYQEQIGLMEAMDTAYADPDMPATGHEDVQQVSEAAVLGVRDIGLAGELQKSAEFDRVTSEKKNNKDKKKKSTLSKGMDDELSVSTDENKAEAEPWRQVHIPEVQTTRPSTVTESVAAISAAAVLMKGKKDKKKGKKGQTFDWNEGSTGTTSPSVSATTPAAEAAMTENPEISSATLESSRPVVEGLRPKDADASTLKQSKKDKKKAKKGKSMAWDDISEPQLEPEPEYVSQEQALDNGAPAAVLFHDELTRKPSETSGVDREAFGEGTTGLPASSYGSPRDKEALEDSHDAKDFSLQEIEQSANPKLVQELDPTPEPELMREREDDHFVPFETKKKKGKQSKQKTSTSETSLRSPSSHVPNEGASVTPFETPRDTERGELHFIDPDKNLAESANFETEHPETSKPSSFADERLTEYNEPLQEREPTNDDEFVGFATKKKGKKGKKGSRADPVRSISGSTSTAPRPPASQAEPQSQSMSEALKSMVTTRPLEEETELGTAPEEQAVNAPGEEFPEFGTIKRKKSKKPRKQQPVLWEDDATRVGSPEIVKNADLEVFNPSSEQLPTMAQAPEISQSHSVQGELKTLTRPKLGVTDLYPSYNTANEIMERGEYPVLLLEDPARHHDSHEEPRRSLEPNPESLDPTQETTSETAAKEPHDIREHEIESERGQLRGLLSQEDAVHDSEGFLSTRVSQRSRKKHKDNLDTGHSLRSRSSSRSLGLLPGDVQHDSVSPKTRSSFEELVDSHHNEERPENLSEGPQPELNTIPPPRHMVSYSTPGHEVEFASIIPSQSKSAADMAEDVYQKKAERPAAKASAVAAGVALFEDLHRKTSVSETDKIKKRSYTQSANPEESKGGESSSEHARETLATHDYQYSVMSEHTDQKSSVVTTKLHQAAQDVTANRDSAIHVSNSTPTQELAPFHQSLRDSGYQGTEVSPTFPDIEQNTVRREARMSDDFITQGEPRRSTPNRDSSSTMFGDTNRSSMSMDDSAENPLNISIEVDPAYKVSVFKPEHRHKHERTSSTIQYDASDSELPRHAQGHHERYSPTSTERQPSPIDSTTKARSSELFQSSPSTREDLVANHSREASAADYASRYGQNDERSRVVNVPSSPTRLPVHTEPLLPNDVATTHERGPSLFGGPIGINSDIQSILSPPHTPPSSTRRQLNTIDEHRPMDESMHKPARAVSDVGLPEHKIKTARRSTTPQGVSQLRVHSPLAKSVDNEEYPSTDDMISRLSWPAVDEEAHSVDLDRNKSRNTDEERRSLSRQSPLPLLASDAMKQYETDLRPVSGASIRSGESINAIIRSPIIQSPGTPPLRRADRSVSSDLRAANRHSGAKNLAKQIDAELDNEPVVASSSSHNPLSDKGKGRITKMADVYEGWGDVHDSPRSPTRPASMRKRQSMQLIDLQVKLDQLLSENRTLQDAKARADVNLNEVVHQQNEHTSALVEAIESRDLYLKEKDEELNELRRTLDGLHNEVSRLTKVNEGLQGSTKGISSEHEQRYSQLESEHAEVHERWQETTRELEDMKNKHASLSGGMESIVRHEVEVALASKNAELLQMRGELDAAKDQVRRLQQEILASRSSEDTLIERDEDYFDSQCQDLCQRVQLWVLRFSKFSDSKVCHSINDVADEKITDRFDNAILDGSDVDIYLKDRTKRRDVFMSVVMTMIWEYVFTRYLFGMDREQRSKLKSLEKILSEVGPPKAVNKWRATTLSMLAKREAFDAQRQQDTEAVVQEIYDTLATLLSPPAHLAESCVESLRKVMSAAVDLSIEMRTQRAEYIMLPPLQPEYDTNGDLARQVYFNPTLMNERSGTTSSNEELGAQQAVVRMVLFPLVVKRGDDDGVGSEEIVVCPAQVLIAKDDDRKGDKKSARVMSAQSDRMEGVSNANQSVQSFAPSSMEPAMGRRF